MKTRFGMVGKPALGKHWLPGEKPVVGRCEFLRPQGMTEREARNRQRSGKLRVCYSAGLGQVC